MEIIDSKILKVSQHELRKSQPERFRCFPSGRKIRSEGNSGLPSDPLEPFGERETMVVVACSVDWSNCLFEGKAAFESQK